MRDLEMTKLCAEAMGKDALEIEQSLFLYDPLHDDAQAMALVKKLNLIIGRTPMQWAVTNKPMDWDLPIDCQAINQPWVYSENLNRAIVECGAKIQAAK